jgi:hypothetical protein
MVTRILNVITARIKEINKCNNRETTVPIKEPIVSLEE